MRVPWRLAVQIVAAFLLLTTVGAWPDERRISFNVTTIEERSGQRNVVSAARIDGPPGTDFRVLLDSARFEMTARFVTDLVAPERLRVRAQLKTRRLYGYSPRNLPLYEEDTQDSVIELGLDDALVLLPFGSGDADEQLKIEIVPEFGASMAASAPQPLKIDILKTSPGGIVRILAEKIPHHFSVEASVLRDGVELARGRGGFRLEERGTLELLPVVTDGSAAAFRLGLTVDNFARSRPDDRVSIRFNLDRTGQGSGDIETALARKWAGVTSLAGQLNYEIPSGLVLRLRVREGKGPTVEVER